MKHLVTTACCLTLGAGLGMAAPVPAVPVVAHPFFRQKAVERKALPASDSGSVVVNAASYLPGISPGGLATVFGTNLSDVKGIVSAGVNPFPLVLADVSVTVNGVPAPMFSVAYADGQDQISFQVPWATNVGPGAARVRVYDYGNLVADVIVDSYTEDPGIFAFSKYGQLYAVALHSDDYALVTPDDPAYRGEVLILYTTGLGPVDSFVPDGYGAPSNPLTNTKYPFRVVLGGEDARLYFSGLAPGFVGLYQVNIRVPDDLASGDLTLRILSEYADSQTVLLTVR
jgi:minor extracellular serine protease Vpr